MNFLSILYRLGLKWLLNGKFFLGLWGVEGEELLEVMEGDLVWDFLGIEGFGVFGDFLVLLGDCGFLGGDERVFFGDGEFFFLDVCMIVLSFVRFVEWMLFILCLNG